jgi:hypothetical protein
MKKMSIYIATISVVIAGITLAAWLAIRSQNNKWNETHLYINEITKAENYALSRITDRDLDFRYGYAANKELTEYYTDTYHMEGGVITNDYANNQEQGLGGCVFFDSLTKTIWIKTIEVGQSGQNHFELINIGLDGRMISHQAAPDSTVDLQGLLVLKSDVTLWYDWNDKKSNVYVDHIMRQEFNWGSLNPFKGFGNPTGGGTTIYWKALAFLNIELESSKLKFKTKTATVDQGDYSLNAFVYRVPKKYTNGLEMVFLYMGSERSVDKDDTGLYLIMKI